MLNGDSLAFVDALAAGDMVDAHFSSAQNSQGDDSSCWNCHGGRHDIVACIHWLPNASFARSTNQFIAPRLSTNDIKLASDDPSKSIVLVTRGAGYSQFGGMPVIADSEFHISEEEFLRRKHMPWPAGESGTFVPQTWTPQSASKPQTRKRKSSAPLVTEETIGEPPTKSLFDHFLGQQSTLS